MSRLPNNNQIIEYSFYEKPGNCEYTTIETSAMCKEEMTQQLSQEVVRRLARMDSYRSQEEKDAIINKYTDKLQKSGHSVNQCRVIVISGIRRYQSILKDKIDKGLPMNRRLTCPRRRLSKLIKDKSDKTMWYNP